MCVFLYVFSMYTYIPIYRNYMYSEHICVCIQKPIRIEGLLLRINSQLWGLASPYICRMSHQVKAPQNERLKSVVQRLTRTNPERTNVSAQVQRQHKVNVDARKTMSLYSPVAGFL